jgi:hypothetical protein
MNPPFARDRGPAAPHLEAASKHADLGLPVPAGTRFRLLKRVLGRAMWVFGRHQVTYNHAMIDAAGELANSVEAVRTDVPEQVGNEVGGMRSEIGTLEVRLGELEACVQELSRRLDRKDS